MMSIELTAIFSLVVLLAGYLSNSVSDKKFDLISFACIISCTVALITHFIFKNNSIDSLTISFAFLTLFISLIITKFSTNYLSGENQRKKYFFLLTLLTLSLVLMIQSQSIILLGFFFLLSNLIFSQLMMFKKDWQAAKTSAYYFIKLSFLSFSSFSIAAFILITSTHTTNIEQILQNKNQISIANQMIALSLILFSATIQSGLWPYHKWVLSSLNSFTSVTAFMHAGVITGGGMLILRFYDLFFFNRIMLDIIFIIGCISLILGTLLKLTQNSLKKALACSTIAQMGFMFMQIGLALPIAAFFHILFHSLFKAFLFLNSPSYINQRTQKETNNVNFIPIIASIFIAFVATIVFIKTISQPLSFVNTSSILNLFVFLTALQISLKTLKTKVSLLSFFFVSIIVNSLSFIYGLLNSYFKYFLHDHNFVNELPISSIHIISILLILSLSLMVNLKVFGSSNYLKKIYPRFFVFLLNHGQSKSNTTNAVRTEYQN